MTSSKLSTKFIANISDMQQIDEVSHFISRSLKLIFHNFVHRDMRLILKRVVDICECISELTKTPKVSTKSPFATDLHPRATSTPSRSKRSCLRLAHVVIMWKISFWPSKLCLHYQVFGRRKK